jgi:hypothetical protein
METLPALVGDPFKTVPEDFRMHLVNGSGGARMALICAGSTGAFNVGGKKEKFDSMAATSGSGLPTGMFAANVPQAEIVGRTIECDFKTLLPKVGSVKELLRDVGRREIHREASLQDGLFDTAPLGEAAVRNIGPVLPEPFWVPACAEGYIILFTWKGVFELTPDGRVNIVQSEPAPTDIAIRATATMPFLMKPLIWKKRCLMDGALSVYGGCPTGIAKHHFGAKDENIIAVRPEPPKGRVDRVLSLVGLHRDELVKGFGKHLIGNHETDKLLDHEGGLVIEPSCDELGTFDFHPTKDQKRRVILNGFTATRDKRAQAGHYTKAEIDELVRAGKDWDSFCSYIGLPQTTG